MSTHLSYDIFIAEPIPQNVTELLPNGDRPMWSPLSTTLVHGRSDAVLIDPPLTREQAHAVGDWVPKSAAQFDLLDSGDRTTVDLDENWF